MASGDPTQSTEIATRPAAGLPRDLDSATALLAELGYTQSKAYRVELDRILAASIGRINPAEGKGAAFTLTFEFDAAEEHVHIHESEGWPIED